MMYAFPPSRNDRFAQMAFFEAAFSSDECEIIKSLFSEDSESAKTGGGHENIDVRKSKICWVQPSDETQWIFDRLAKFVRSCNGFRWQFSLSGFFEPLQLGRYQEGEFYSWHQDNGEGQFSVRKLSIVLQLSDSYSYEGGDLQFLGHETLPVPRSKGSLILFPSFNPHQVTKVTKGERFSLVGWVTGEPYR